MSKFEPKRTKERPLLVKALREMGYKVSGVMKLLGTSRATFYKKAQQPTIAFLQTIQAVTSPKLEEYFPALKAKSYPTLAAAEEATVADTDTFYKKIIEQRYYQLLEDHNAVLAHYTNLKNFLVKIANHNDLPELKEEIAQFIGK